MSCSSSVECRSFAPAVPQDARILILGSMPGVESLRRQQYYAFPRNAFWWIMGEIFGFSGKLPYADRLRALNDAGVGLWDVLHCCEREGSSDSAIRSAEPNPVDELLRTHPSIRKICCNGGTAGKNFLHFFPEIGVQTEILISTSPAAAAVGRGEKLIRWRKALTEI